MVRIYIKNMVCIRCIMLVKSVLTKLKIPYNSVELGLVKLKKNISDIQHQQLFVSLLASGLEIIDNKKSILIEKIKSVIIEAVHYTEEPLRLTFSEHLSQKLHHDYTYMANLFSEVQGITIEKFIITHKIERVKEFLVYNELSLTEIAELMNYSSVSYLSTQFKKVTGLSPSHFKKLKYKRKTLLLEGDLKNND